MLEQQIDLVNIDPGVPSQFSVPDDAVEYAVQNHQHTNRQKLLAQIPDIVAKDTGVGIHIGGLGEGVQAALGKQFDGQSHVRCLRLRLAKQFCMEVPEGGDSPFTAVLDVGVVAQSRTPVNDGLLLGGQLAGPHELLTQGEDEFGL